MTDGFGILAHPGEPALRGDGLSGFPGIGVRIACRPVFRSHRRLDHRGLGRRFGNDRVRRLPLGLRILVLAVILTHAPLHSVDTTVYEAGEAVFAAGQARPPGFPVRIRPWPAAALPRRD